MSDFKFSVLGAEVHVPDGKALPEALSRTTHMGVGAHQDDLEFMAFAPILECHGKADLWFTGVTTTNGSGSARDGVYAKYTDAEMVAIRRTEQRKAANIGQYAAQFQLNHPSSAVKDPVAAPVVADLTAILKACKPRFVYTHNLADKHDTHVGVALRLLAAIRSLPRAERPEKLVGCEVWRDLDWMQDADKVLMAVDGNDQLAGDIMAVYESQIAGGKRYDLATRGRRRANATFFESHATDKVENLIFGMDLTPLIQDDSLAPKALFQKYLKNFEGEVMTRLAKL